MQTPKRNYWLVLVAVFLFTSNTAFAQDEKSVGDPERLAAINQLLQIQFSSSNLSPDSFVATLDGNLLDNFFVAPVSNSVSASSTGVAPEPDVLPVGQGAAIGGSGGDGPRPNGSETGDGPRPNSSELGGDGPRPNGSESGDGPRPDGVQASQAMDAPLDAPMEVIFESSDIIVVEASVGESYAYLRGFRSIESGTEVVRIQFVRTFRKIGGVWKISSWLEEKESS